MNGFVINVLDGSVYISTFLIIVLGSLITICLLMYPVWYLLNNILYKRTKASVYFISYIKNRKGFIEWKNKRKPDVHSGEIKNNNF